MTSRVCLQFLRQKYKRLDQAAGGDQFLFCQRSRPSQSEAGRKSCKATEFQSSPGPEGRALHLRIDGSHNRIHACFNPRPARGPGIPGPSFNGGPGNCPAKPHRGGDPVEAGEPSMEGRAIARPNQQLSQRRVHLGVPSMEGRAIARPNARMAAFNRAIAAKPAGSGSGHPSMEGRAIARPNAPGRLFSKREVVPSMEGRAIARPNRLLDSGSLNSPFAEPCERCKKRRASKVRSVNCQAAVCLAPQGFERSLGLGGST